MNSITVSGVVMYEPFRTRLSDGREVVNIKIQSNKNDGSDIYDVFQLILRETDVEPAMYAHTGDHITASGELWVKTKKQDGQPDRVYLNIRVSRGCWELAQSEVKAQPRYDESMMIRRAPSRQQQPRPRFVSYGEKDIEWE